jgi:BspA type Leucine rich repeat region (6 copies)
MKKIFLAGLVLMVAYQVGFAGGFEGQGEDNNGLWYCDYISSGNQCIILGNVYNTISATATVVYIPSSVSNNGGFTIRTVTQLGNGSTIIYDQPSFFSLSIPSQIQSINSYAFANLQNLTTVVINGSPCIEPNAFFNCPHLTDVPSVSCDIGDSAFEGCVKLRSVGLKDGVTKIGKRAFANCKNLKSLTIPRTVISIAPDAFVGSGIKYVVMQRGGAPINSFPKGVYVTVKQLPYPKK